MPHCEEYLMAKRQDHAKLDSMTACYTRNDTNDGVFWLDGDKATRGNF